MADARMLLAQAGGPQSDPFLGFVPLLLVFVIFYFILIRPARVKQRKLEALVKSLKSGDKVIINPGIFGTIVGVEDEAFYVRVDEKTKIKILKSAVAGVQGGPAQTEKK